MMLVAQDQSNIGRRSRKPRQGAKPNGRNPCRGKKPRMTGRAAGCLSSQSMSAIRDGPDHLCCRGGLISSQGLTLNAFASRPSTLTLAETRARSIEPT